MSNEEKEALEILKLYFGEEPTLNITKYVNIVLNLIEKQQKEIEKLKKYEEGYKLLSYSLDNYISKDKIKAKIEPKLKELDKNMKKEWIEYGNSREYQDMEDEWNFLQSLLEKK